MDKNIIKDIHKGVWKKKWYDMISMSAENDINGKYHACISWFKGVDSSEHWHIDLTDNDLRELRDWIDLFFETHRK